ncbi:MAG: hypothetical protein J6Z79_03755 [Clostridia bacterium]|nr:hypothetical protein [Clostridia bacterium]
MNTPEQVETLKQALDLTLRREELQNRATALSRQSFKAKPAPPVRTEIKVEYPPIKSNVKFWGVELLPTLIFILWPIFYYFLFYKKRKEEDIERIKNSEEYKASCAKAEEDAKAKQAEIDEKYQADKKEYEEVILPQYEKDLAAWQKKHEEEMNACQADLSDTQNRLEKLYEETKIIPVQYRGIPALRHIYNTVSSSDYSVREAIEAYEQERARQLEVAKIQEQQRANDIADEKNDLLAEQNEIAEKTRKDARNAAFVGAIQSHNRNKSLKGIDKSLRR